MLPQLYTHLHYLRLLPNPASTQPYNDPTLRYEVRMRPFLTLQDGFGDMYDEWVLAVNPFGDFDAPNVDLGARAGGLCDIADAAVREARSAFSQLKAMGASKACAEKVERSWVAVRPPRSCLVVQSHSVQGRMLMARCLGRVREHRVCCGGGAGDVECALRCQHGQDGGGSGVGDTGAWQALP